MTDADVVMEVLRVARKDQGLDMEDLTVTGHGPLRLAVLCNDTFAWATADLHEITQDNIEDFVEFHDWMVENYSEDFLYVYFPVLWVSKQRGMRPQKPYFNPKYLDERLWELAESFGPNPYDS